MITRVSIQRFKRFEDAAFDLGHATVLIGPNNAGKTTALQALALWDAGLRIWLDKREGGNAEKRAGVTINRRALTSIPVPSTKLLWHDLKTQFSPGGAGTNQKHYITVTVEGLDRDVPWECGLEFYYANEESFYCRPVGGDDAAQAAQRSGLPSARKHRIVYLPPMSGLAEEEPLHQPGTTAVLIGQGRTAEVLRNLAWRLWSDEDKSGWEALVGRMQRLFNIEINPPEFVDVRGELRMDYIDAGGIRLDIAAAGRGCQQVLLLLTFMLSNPGTVLLLDEPDAHLEILRQRDIYRVLTEVAQAHASQVVAASHSEVLLNEAAGRDVVIAFVGQPQRLDDQSEKAQLRKALRSIPAADYYVAELKRWYLYLEGATDLEILTTLARRLNHPAGALLATGVPVHYLGNNDLQLARDHFHGLRFGFPGLRGVVLVDRIGKSLQTGPLVEQAWRKREIENYLVSPESILAMVNLELRPDDLFDDAEFGKRRTLMEESLKEAEDALAFRELDPWGPDIKVTDEFLDPLMRRFYKKLGTPQRLFKRDYHLLAETVDLATLDPEIGEKLDAIAAEAAAASGGG